MISRYGTIILKPIAPKITTKIGVKQHTATIIVPAREAINVFLYLFISEQCHVLCLFYPFVTLSG